MLLNQILIFTAGSVLIVYFSRHTFKAIHSHGFYRFFVWELILLLFAIKMFQWFRDPFDWHQIVSWILLLVSLVPLFLGVSEMRRANRSAARRSAGSELYTFEKTTNLVTSGIFRYIRHPMYSSLLLLAWGIFFKEPDFFGTVLTIVIAALLVKTARADEAECIQYFGDPYRKYMNKTRMFIPHLF